ncbi:xanthine dehydrogenase family protein molybdopterin-binding subunit [Phenylobacterium deserti]|uniref:Xanthine dehydrogenase family protein molybdopterin-binding subunit n=2 Tax=Phenylobacterium deserti TaxID=1914756 RepID=A0A328ADV0_9CAUL|nr:xanthine dehydrogenase family protein molybdopterin-binding subunit [Phenylobacterium deserti]
MGQAIPRYEATAKVTGQPLYAADEPIARPLYAFFKTSGVARGTIASLDVRKAEAMPGVMKVYTHRNAPPRKAVKHIMTGGYMSDTNIPLADNRVRHDGDIVAMVVADSYEIARDAANRIEVRYAAQAPAATFGSPGAVKKVPEQAQKNAKKAGDFAAGWSRAPVKVDARYSTPTQHHNPIELYATTAVWNGDQLTFYEPSQFVYSTANGLAEQIGVDPAKVHLVNPYVGGGFGGKGILTQRTALVALAARDLGRPVKLVLHRKQAYGLTTYRAETRQRVRLGADRNGKLVAFAHDGEEVTSRADDYMVGGVENTVEMYACPNIATSVTLVKADRNTPGFMRSPPETPYMFGLESAMDELAVALNMDPVELRRINDTQKSPISGAPYTSRSLMQCYDQAAAAFGWSRRNPRPLSMSQGDWLIGWGCATATYPTNMMASTARIRLTADGKAVVEVAAHDMGQGAYTAMQQIAAKRLGLDPRQVTVRMGDSALPPGPVAGGSMTTASAGSAVHTAAGKIAARFGGAMPAPNDLDDAFRRLGVTQIEEYAEWWPPGQGPQAVRALYKGSMGGGGGEEGEQQEGNAGGGKPMMAAFGAEFVEVRIHRLTREIRVPRMTGAFAAGHIVNPRTARSQYLGGMIWGMASALLEATEVDAKRARYVNDNIAEYLVAVNADVPQVDVILVPEVDTKVNPLGVKGIGELANVGTAAAIANAVYHATGKRIRDLPITMDKLLV